MQGSLNCLERRMSNHFFDAQRTAGHFEKYLRGHSGVHWNAGLWDRKAECGK